MQIPEETPDITIKCSNCGNRFVAHKDQVVEQLYWVCTHCHHRQDISANWVAAIQDASEFPSHE
jgi:DNA-directed RNA polymerase subunit RPC12/RpoP